MKETPWWKDAVLAIIVVVLMAIIGALLGLGLRGIP
jgi:hypothetical protein